MPHIGYSFILVTDIFQQERLCQETEIVGSKEECQKEPRVKHMELHRPATQETFLGRKKKQCVYQWEVLFE